MIKDPGQQQYGYSDLGKSQIEYIAAKGVGIAAMFVDAPIFTREFLFPKRRPR